MKKIISFVQKKKWSIVFFLVIAAAFFINTLHESYPDEFDNILGGWYILHGTLIYTGFFTHHGPVPYYLAALVEIFSGRSFVRFRMVYAAFLLLYFFGMSRLLRSHVSETSQKIFTFFIALFAVAATYYWTHMLLADNIAALTFLPAFIVIVDKLFHKTPFTQSDILFVSILMAFGFYASLAYIYVLAIFSIVLLGSYYLSERKKLKGIKDWIMPLVLFAIPHVVFLVYLVATGSVKDYYKDAWVFNEKYYIFNYPRADGASINPIRYAVVIADNFIHSFFSLLIGVKNFSFGLPMNMTLAIGDSALLVYLLVKRKWFLAGLVVCSLIYATPRSNPLLSGETDYQSAVYTLFSYWSTLFVVTNLYQDLRKDISQAQKVIYSSLLVLTGVYGFFALFFLFNNFEGKAYSKYMGNAPLIYDRPSRAPVINTVVGDNDYMWIGPFFFEDLFYANGKIPSKYHILIPGMAKSDQIKAEILADFKAHPPKVAIFDTGFRVLGSNVGDYGSFLVDFFKQNYITLLPYHDGNKIYRSVAPIQVGQLDLETQLFIRKDVVHEVLPKLVAAGYIKEEIVK